MSSVRVPNWVRHWGKKFAWRLGFEIVRAKRPGSMSAGLIRLAPFLNPKTIIDVGVAHGTPELYAAFPEAHFVLVEPLSEYEPFIRELQRQFHVDYVAAAAGKVSGRQIIYLDPAETEGASILVDQVADPHVERREVDVVTIDDAVRDLRISGPVVMKIDVQGAELDVLSGASSILDQTELVIMETSFFQFKHQAPQFAEVVRFMEQLGFVVYDMWNLRYRPLDDALAQVDLAFVPESGALRSSHKWK